MQSIAKFLYNKVLGWTLVGNTNMSKDTVKKAVLIAVPHTSWQDFFLAILMRKVIGVKSNFVGKKELFNFPFGYFFRALGGAALDRTSGQDKVKAIAKLFNEHEEFRIAIAPEGTRKKVDKWKTGFYYIAKEAQVPIIMFSLDFGKKQNKISEPFYPTDNIEDDFEFMHNFYKDAVGKVPKYT